MPIRIQNQADARRIAAAGIESGRGEASAANARLQAQMDAAQAARDKAAEDRLAEGEQGLKRDALKSLTQERMELLRQKGFENTANIRAKSSLLSSQEATRRHRERLDFDASKAIDGTVSEFQTEFGNDLNPEGQKIMNATIAQVNGLMARDDLDQASKFGAIQTVIGRARAPLGNQASKKTSGEVIMERVIATDETGKPTHYLDDRGNPKAFDPTPEQASDLKIKEEQAKAELKRVEGEEKRRQDQDKAEEKRKQDMQQRIDANDKEILKLEVEIEKLRADKETGISVSTEPQERAIRSLHTKNTEIRENLSGGPSVSTTPTLTDEMRALSGEVPGQQEVDSISRDIKSGRLKPGTTDYLLALDRLLQLQQGK